MFYEEKKMTIVYVNRLNALSKNYVNQGLTITSKG